MEGKVSPKSLEGGVGEGGGYPAPWGWPDSCACALAYVCVCVRLSQNLLREGRAVLSFCE